MLVMTNYAKKNYASTVYPSYRPVLWSGRCDSDMHGYPRLLSFPIPKTLVIWASPVTLTPTHIVKVI